MTTFKAFGINKQGGIENLEEFEQKKPTKLQNRELLVKIKAFALNPVDTAVRAGMPLPRKIPLEYPLVIGWDAAGVVEDVAPDCKKFKKGDEVYFMGDLEHGSYAEYIVVDERLAGRKPKNISFAEAAALPLTTLTAWEMLFDGMNIPLEKEKNSEKTVLVINGSGGLGSIFTQLAKYAGLKVISTYGKEESKQWTKKMGADFVINHREDIDKQLKQIKGCENGVDYVGCCYLTDTYFEQIVNFSKPFGKVSFVRVTEQKHNPSIYARKSMTVFWETVFIREIFDIDIHIHGDILDKVSKLVEEGHIQSTLNKQMKASLENLKEGHKLIESGSTIGKIALVWE